MTSHYNTKGDINLKEEEIKAGKDKAIGMYKVVEEYLLANPDAYAQVITYQSSHYIVHNICLYFIWSW